MRNVLCFFGVRLLSQELCLDDRDNLRSGLLDSAHQAREKRRSVFPIGKRCNRRHTLPTGVAANRSAAKGHAFGDLLALGMASGGW